MDYRIINSILPIKDEYSIQEKIFAARGLSPEKAKRFLNTTKNDENDFFLLDNIIAGAKMLFQHMFNEDKIFILADCDVDGFTSAALLLNYLNNLCPGIVQNNFTYMIHDGKQHGLSDQIDMLESSDYKLVICPDSSSNDYDFHKRLKDKGIDVLVIDHHEAEKVSENACVINNQLSNYPNKALSGVGIVYKFCEYIDSINGSNYAEKYLDLVALGNIADMMDIRELETEYFISQGIANINNPYIKEAVIKQDYSISRYGGLCAHTIAFYIAPQINAVIRIGSEKDKKILFEAMLDYKGNTLIPSTKRGCKGQFEEVAVQAYRNGTNIKKKQDELVKSDMEKVKNIIESKQLYNNKIIAIKIESGLLENKSTTGLIANKLMKEYNHPVLLLNEVEREGELCWDGSARGIDVPDLPSLKDFLQDSNFTRYAEGHGQAFGTSIFDKNFTDFIEYTNEKLKDCEFRPCYDVDFIWDYNDIKSKDIFDIAELNLYYGQNFTQPYVMIKNIPINQNNTALLGQKGTLNINLQNGIRAIKFGAADDYNLIIPDNPYGANKINIIGTCSINEFNGQVNAQIEIIDYEIEKKMEYYF